MSRSDAPPCRETLENVSAYLDGELDRATCDTIERHSRACPGCAALVEDLRSTLGLCKQAAEAGLPDAVRERARAAVELLLKRADETNR
jgi:anti-sigma factor RsiW